MTQMNINIVEHLLKDDRRLRITEINSKIKIIYGNAQEMVTDDLPTKNQKERG